MHVFVILWDCDSINRIKRPRITDILWDCDNIDRIKRNKDTNVDLHVRLASSFEVQKEPRENN